MPKPAVAVSAANPDLTSPSSRRRRRFQQPVCDDVVVGYCRASKDRQRLTPAVQLAALRRWCAENGKTLVANFLDRDVSGASGVMQRPGLLLALAALREHRAGTLLVSVRDRIARSVAVASQIEALVGVEGAALRCADGIGNGVGPDGDLQRGIADVFAQHELGKIRWRTKQALALKKSRGELTGSVPWGFKLSSDGIHLVPDKRETEAVAWAKRLHRRGRSLRDIAATLDARGVRSRSGGPLWPASIQSMLRSEVKVTTMS